MKHIFNLLRCDPGQGMRLYAIDFAGWVEHTFVLQAKGPALDRPSIPFLHATYNVYLLYYVMFKMLKVVSSAAAVFMGHLFRYRTVRKINLKA